MIENEFVAPKLQLATFKFHIIGYICLALAVTKWANLEIGFFALHVT